MLRTPLHTKRAWQRRIQYVAFYALSLLLLFAGSARSGGTREDAVAPVGIKSWLQHALAAVNTRDADALAPLLTADAAASFGWIRETTTRHWLADLLVVPGNITRVEGAAGNRNVAQHPTYLAVFHAWHTCQSDGDHVHPLSLTPRGWRLGPQIPETETGGFRVRDHDLHVTLDVPHRTANISDRASIERTRPETPTYCLLRLNEGYHVRELTCDERAVRFQQAGGILMFATPPAGNFSVGLRYSGVLNHDNGDYILHDEATLNSYWYPNIARLPSTATITATAPPGWTPLAQGEFVRQNRGTDGAISVTYRNDLPVSFFTVDMGRYHLATRRVDGHSLTAYLLRDDPAYADRCLDLLASALHLYESRFARFPYTGYGVVETRGPFDGALEAYSFATFSARGMLENIPHELAHTWWGGLVPCTYTSSMWDESFADYSDHLCQRLLFQRLAAAGAATSGVTPAHLAYGNRFDRFSLAGAYDTSDENQASVGYEKGSMVLCVLEQQLGRDLLQRCMSTFIGDHPRGAAADWPEFEHVVNQVTGIDYRWFFAQWVERTGLPSVYLRGVAVHHDRDQYAVEGDLAQSGTPYRLSVPLLLRLQGGGVIRQDIEVSGADTHFRLHSRSPPARLVIDPDNVLPLSSAEDTARDLTQSDK